MTNYTYNTIESKTNFNSFHIYIESTKSNPFNFSFDILKRTSFKQ